MRPSTAAPAFVRILAYSLFVLSGGAGLIYQAIWSHYLGLYLGHAAYAQSLVLAIFMGGMALGAWLVSRRSDGRGNLLRAYAWTELVIGAFGLLFHREFLATTDAAYSTILPALGSAGVAVAFKWLSGALLILPQSVLLGMTFPLLSNGIIRRTSAAPGRILSSLYFGNSAGAAVGALVATFVLLPRVGMPGAMLVAGALNVLVGVVAGLLSRSADAPVPAPADAPQAASEAGGPQRLLLAAALVTGLTSFVYEIGWVRMLSLTAGTTLHAFELMLAAFIGGLALGGFAIRRRIDAYADPIRVGGWVQIAMGVAALATLTLYGHSFDWVAAIMRGLSRTDTGYTFYNVSTAAIAVVIMLPAAFFAGMTLPLFTLALMRAGGGEGAVGRIYAANTLGAIVGVFLTVHALIPVLGLKLAMTAAGVADIALGAVLLRRSLGAQQPLRYAAALLGAGAATALCVAASPFDPRNLASGVYRTGVAHVPAETKLLYYRDGKTASVALAETDGQRTVATNGKSDAAIQMNEADVRTPDESTMTLLALLPVLLHPQAKEFAVIGFGSGMSTSTILGNPDVTRVDTIEIEPAMIAAARGFGRFSAPAFEDPRSHIHIDDAKTYFSTHNAQYDVIVSEPSNPWVSGIASLFTREFYAHAARHLKPHGLMVQWVQLYEIDDALVASIVNALSAQFRDYRLYLANESDLVIVARADGDVGEPDAGVFARPLLRAALERVHIANLADLRLHALGGRALLEPFFRAHSTVLNSDYLPRLSLDAPRARFAQASATHLLRLAYSDLPLLELLGASGAHTPDVPTQDPNFGRTQLAALAATLVAYVHDPAQGDAGARLNPELAQVAAALRDYGRSCGKTASGPTAASWMFQLAGVTLPYLPPAQASELWNPRTWRPCEHYPGVAEDMSEFVHALARRDFAAASERGRALLRAGELTPDVADYVLRGSILADLARGRPDAAMDLVRDVGTTLPPTRESHGERIFLRAVAELRAGHTE